MEKQELLNRLLQSNLLSLAFIGDAVHTLFIREKVLIKSADTMQNYHNLASKHCKAQSQAESLNIIFPILSVEEQEIVRRARNAKPKHTAKSSTNADYSQATAFEALIGFLYLSQNERRLEEILNLSLQKEKQC